VEYTGTIICTVVRIFVEERAVGWLTGIWHGLDEAFFMFWETLWALVLGFALSGAVQAFVSRGEMRKALGDHRPATLAKSSFLGMVSSSCPTPRPRWRRACSPGARTSPPPWSS